jgi:hypothetical protein
MKALPGLLVEYLITGTLPVLAFVLIKENGWAPVPTLSIGSGTASSLALWIPGIYCLGIMVDFFSRVFSRTLRISVGFLWDSIAARVGWLPIRTELHGSMSLAEILAKSEILGQEYVLRSSRDRVARGMFFVCFVSTVWLAVNGRWISVTLWGVTVTALCFVMWWRLDRLSKRWRQEASNVLSGSSGK